MISVRASITQVRARFRAEQGYTLIEVLVVLSILSAVAGLLMAPLVLGQREQTRDANYAFAQQDARNGLDAMVSQIRQATSIISSGPNFVEMTVTLGGVAEHVLYECDIPQPGTAYRECMRAQSAAGSPLPPLTGAAVGLTNLTNGTVSSPVFSFGPDPIAPYYMTATVSIPASDGAAGGLSHSIVLSDGALMRNENVGN